MKVGVRITKEITLLARRRITLLQRSNNRPISLVLHNPTTTTLNTTNKGTTKRILSKSSTMLSSQEASIQVNPRQENRQAMCPLLIKLKSPPSTNLNLIYPSKDNLRMRN